MDLVELTSTEVEDALSVVAATASDNWSRSVRSEVVSLLVSHFVDTACSRRRLLAV